MNIKKLLLSVLLMSFNMVAMAQNFEIKNFEEDLFDLYARNHAVYDHAGHRCAVVRFSVPSKGFSCDGVIKQIKRDGEIIVFIPQGTERLTMRHSNHGMMRDYKLPVRIESQVTYKANVIIKNPNLNVDPNSGHNVYVGAGFNVMSIMGPSISLGFDLNRHNAELSFVYGDSL